MAIIGQDTFLRPNQSGWGTASDGQVWAHTVGTSTLAIASNEGTSTNDNSLVQLMTLGSASQLDTDVVVRFKWTANASVNAGVFLRAGGSSAANHYRCRYNGSNIGLRRIIGGVSTTLGTDANFNALSIGAFYWIRLRATSATITTKIWADGSPEPLAWTQTVVDTAIMEAGGFGIYSQINNITDTISFDSFTATDTRSTAPSPRYTPRGLGATIVPDVVTQPLSYKERGIGGTIIYEIRTFIPRALGGTYTPETWNMLPRAFGARFVQSFPQQLKNIGTRLLLQAGGTLKQVDLSLRLLLLAVVVKNLASRVRLLAVATKDIVSRVRLQASTQIDLKTRVRLLALAQKDIATRTKLLQVTLKDLPSRTKVLAVGVKDLASRLRLAIPPQLSLATRTKLLAVALKDLASRVRVQVTTSRDLASRAIVAAVAQKDLKSRTRLLAVAVKDVALRLRLAIPPKLDVSARVRLLAVALKDTSSRTRLLAVRQQDLASRTKLLQVATKNVASRLLLQAIGLVTKDLKARLLLLAVQIKDQSTRIKIAAVRVQNTASRLRLLGVSAANNLAVRIRLFATPVLSLGARLLLIRVPITYFANPGDDLSAKLAILLPGDTLSLNDGTYLAGSGTGRLYISNLHGSDLQYITIKATNDGQAIIDGQSAFEPLFMQDSSYVTIQGLRFQNSSVSVVRLFGDVTGNQHINIRRCTAFGAGAGNHQVFAITDNSNFVLVEDCAGWGRGRYIFQVYHSHNVTFRRCFGYQPWQHQTDFANAPRVGFGVYGAHDVIVENCIARHVVPFEADNNYYSAFWHDDDDQANFPSYNVAHRGNIYYDSSEGIAHAGTSMSDASHTYKDIYLNIPFNSTASGFQTTRYADHSIDWDSGNTGDGVLDKLTIQGGVSAFHMTTTGASVSITNSVFLNNTTVYTLNIPLPRQNNDYSGNTTIGTTLGGSELTTAPHYDTATYGSGAYLIAPSNLKGLGVSGSDIGAEILYRYVDGTLTTDPLWPWPMESRVEAELGVSPTWESNGSATGGPWKTLVGIYGPATTDNTATRLRLLATIGKDSSLRLKLLATVSRNTSSRLRLRAVKLTDTAARLRVQSSALAIKDVITRLRLLSLSRNDVRARLVLTITGTQHKLDCSLRIHLYDNTLAFSVLVTRDGTATLLTRDGAGTLATRDGSGTIPTRDGSGTVVTRDGAGTLITR